MVHQPSHLFVGSGRLAKHLHHYFTLKQVPVLQWSRRQDTDREFRELANQAQWVWLLISDSEISPFIEAHPEIERHRWVHCSGCLVLPEITSLHPLMSFANELYPLDIYSRMLFVGEPGHPPLATVCPELDNPFRRLAPEDKARYHALCVAANNFSVLLWQTAAREFLKWGISWQELLPYLEVTMNNLATHPTTALTGPLSRGDWPTIERNQAALAGTPLAPVYDSFVKLFLLSQPQPKENTRGVIDANA
jgi:predicted short-subunit dehydrogenase-like oxidoreductase (DUF2520 family)